MIRRFVRSPCTLLAAGLLLTSAHGGVADARRSHASSGSSIRVDGEQVGDFRFSPIALGGGTALTWTQAGYNGGWYIPLEFDTEGAKTIVVIGKLGSILGGLGCRAMAIDTLGNVVSMTEFITFPVGPSFGSITLNLPTAPANSFGLLQCNFTGNMVSFLLGADYNP